MLLVAELRIILEPTDAADGHSISLHQSSRPLPGIEYYTPPRFSAYINNNIEKVGTMRHYGILIDVRSRSAQLTNTALR